MTEDNRITEFWSWFSDSAGTLLDAYENGNTDWLNSHPSSRVRKLGAKLNWEIGPYYHPEKTFVLSPTIRANLPLTRTTIARAPRLDGWRFLHAKPRKDLTSLRYEANGHSVNADEWLYRMTTYNGGEFVDIELFSPGADDLPTGHEQLFCELAVESLIGEELRLDRVGYLQPCLLAADTDSGGLTELQHLYDHLLSVLDPSPNTAEPSESG